MAWSGWKQIIKNTPSISIQLILSFKITPPLFVIGLHQSEGRGGEGLPQLAALTVSDTWESDSHNL